MPTPASKKDKKDLLSFVVDKKVTNSSKSSITDQNDEQSAHTKKEPSQPIKSQQADHSQKISPPPDQKTNLKSNPSIQNPPSKLEETSQPRASTVSLSEDLLLQKQTEDSISDA